MNSSALTNWTFDDFVTKALDFIQSDAKMLLEVMETTDLFLKSHGLPGEPLYSSWENFRPLKTTRSTREEDWSDWLAFLIEQSDGYFNQKFFQLDKLCKSKKVKREHSIENRRADIIVTWDNGDMLNLEVKIGDKNFIKTYDTAEKINEKNSKNNVQSLILLPSNDIDKWESIKNICDADFGFSIDSITWETVATSIRRSIPLEKNPLFKVIAYIFLAAIEQNILYFLIKDEIEKSLKSKKISFIVKKQLLYLQSCIE